MKKSKINIPLLIVGILLTVVGFTLFVLSLYKFDVCYDSNAASKTYLSKT